MTTLQHLFKICPKIKNKSPKSVLFECVFARVCINASVGLRIIQKPCIIYQYFKLLRQKPNVINVYDVDRVPEKLTVMKINEIGTADVWWCVYPDFGN